MNLLHFPCKTLHFKNNFSGHLLPSLYLYNNKELVVFAPYHRRIRLVSPLTPWTEENGEMGREGDGKITPDSK
jgi:hypothetical protein